MLGRLAGRAEHEHVGLLRLAFEVALRHALANGLVGTAGGFDVIDEHAEFVALGADGEDALFLLFDGGFQLVLLDGAKLVGDGGATGDEADLLTQLLALLQYHRDGGAGAAMGHGVVQQVAQDTFNEHRIEFEQGQIIEEGAYAVLASDPASRFGRMVAMQAGADFIKTSTGKESVNATLPVSLTMIRCIRDYQDRTGIKVGYKPAGGISKAKDSLLYLALMKDELGHPWLQPDLFRFGASSLLGDIERQLEHYLTGHYSAANRHAMG